MRLNCTKALSFCLFILSSHLIHSQPSVTSLAATSITATGATLGGIITSTGGKPITANGTYWKASAGVSSADHPSDLGGGVGTGPFTEARTGMPSATQIFFKAFATNADGTTATAETSFYTFSVAPTAHPASFTAVTGGATQINLAFPAAST